MALANLFARSDCIAGIFDCILEKRRSAHVDETGATVNVPLFVESGDVIRIDTRDRRYIGRSS